ncbi:MAG TPA: glycosyltransferase [Gemmataceae bacterium]|jgi:GT2 family glycosyltransferase|nr:glycosyltransferase [Gemmataceae bacterium]
MREMSHQHNGSPCFPIMVKVWAGLERHDFRYIRRSLPSLLSSDLPAEARVIFVNDRSLDPRIEGYLADLARRHAFVEVWTNPERLGPNKGQEYNVPRVLARFPDAPYLVLCDDDIIYHPGWLQRLIQVYQDARAAGMRGVFTALNVPFRASYASLRLPTSEVLLKERQAALNWLLPREVYDAVGPFRDTGIAYDTEYCNRLAALGIPVICMKPSYVQNIGYHGAYQNGDFFTARDYVGRRDAYLVARDLWYGVKRQTVGRLRDYSEKMPDGKLKRAGLRLYRGMRSLVTGSR